MIFLLLSVMIFLNAGFEINRLMKKKVRNSVKSQLFAEDFAQRLKWFFQWSNSKFFVELKFPSCVTLEF